LKKYVIGIVLIWTIILSGCNEVESTAEVVKQNTTKSELEEINLQITNQNSSYDEEMEETTITGEIKNDYSQELEYIEIEIVYYDVDGNQIFSDFTNTCNLESGKIWKFELNYWEDFDSYKLNIGDMFLSE
jgi:hypothetical protein